MQGRLIFTALSLLAAAPLAACTDDGTGDGPVVADPPPAITADPSMLLTLPLDHGGSIEFREAAPGQTAIVERGPLGLEPHTGAAGESFAQAYARVRPGEVVPPALVLADARAAAAATIDGGAIAVGATDQGSTEHPIVFTADDQAWFNNTFCPGASQCVHGWDWATADFTSHGAFVVTQLGGEATQNAVMRGSWNECHGHYVPPFTWETVCSWHNDNTCGDQVVPPGWWISCDFHLSDAHPTHYEITQGGGATVSLATKLH
jgi:hypothetical protein